MVLGPKRSSWEANAGLRAPAVALGTMLLCALSCPLPKVEAQQGRRPLEPSIASQPETPQHRTRLMLKDGSYQIVLDYRVDGKLVRYHSAERNGAAEDIPLALVDLSATQAWERAHDPANPAPQGEAQRPVLSPELAREEAFRKAQTPEVATTKDGVLRLPEDDSVLGLDTFQGTPELVPFPQQNSDLNRETAHGVQPRELNPAASPHDVFFLKEERADVQLHVPDPAIFIRLDAKNAAEPASGGAAFEVDTHGDSGRSTPAGGSLNSRYVIERLDVRRGERAVSSLRLRLLGTGQVQPDIIETRVEDLNGGIWEKLTPLQPLAFGEYALIEVLDEHAMNIDVWDFGVHPQAKENDEAIHPEPQRPVRLERR